MHSCSSTVYLTEPVSFHLPLPCRCGALPKLGDDVLILAAATTRSCGREERIDGESECEWGIFMV